MKELSSADIVDIIYTHIRTSELAKEVPTLYKYKHFLNPSGEFIVVAPLVNVINNSQIANVNVNIYVPDETPTLDRKEQRYPNDERLKFLSDLAIKTLKGYPSDKRYFFRVDSESITSEENMSYSFVTLRGKLTNS